MTTVEIRLDMPGELAAEVLSKPEMFELIEQNKDPYDLGAFAVDEDFEEGGGGREHYDVETVMIALAGTAAGAAAIQGLFGVIKTVVIEAFNIRRQKRSQEH